MECMTPYLLKVEDDHRIPVPCGKCPACYKRRISGWSFRLKQQEKVSKSSQFITLTYADYSLPFSINGYESLSKRDVQNFFKRLRKVHQSEIPIKYFACGEYGGVTRRPHYHILLFNAAIDTIQEAWKLDNKIIGNVHYDEVNGATIGYALKYMCKPYRIPQFDGDDREKEFQLMSKGIGISYVNDKTIRYHNADASGRMYLTVEEGLKLSMPRYYKNKLYSEDDKDWLAYVAAETAKKRYTEKMAQLVKQYGSEKEAIRAVIESNYNEFRKMNKSSKKRDKL